MGAISRTLCFTEKKKKKPPEKNKHKQNQTKIKQEKEIEKERVRERQSVPERAMVFWAATGAPKCATIQCTSEGKDPGSSKLWAAEKASVFFLLFVKPFFPTGRCSSAFMAIKL
jgi:hypothetical protein